jgi:hypothetical protein
VHALPYILQLLLLLGLPAWFIVSLWRATERDRCAWLLKALYSGAFIGYLTLLGRWDFVSVYLRAVVVVAYGVAVFRSLRTMRTAPWFANGDRPQRMYDYAVSTAFAALFTGGVAWALSGRVYSETPVAMEWPLREGRFYIGQGGNSRSVNYHNKSAAQQYALDIVELNEFGARASGLSPRELDKYEIFGSKVRSPCDAQVEAAVDRLPDLIPPQSDRENVAGNHVVLSCKGVLVLLAHLQAGSVQVARGQSLDTGAIVGLVGNSGNTSEPHLHFHAVRAGSGDVLKGNGVPVTFDGNFPVRNSTL